MDGSTGKIPRFYHYSVLRTTDLGNGQRSTGGHSTFTLWNFCALKYQRRQFTMSNCRQNVVLLSSSCHAILISYQDECRDAHENVLCSALLTACSRLSELCSKRQVISLSASFVNFTHRLGIVLSPTPVYLFTPSEVAFCTLLQLRSREARGVNFMLGLMEITSRHYC
jgi:hypothetical protein